MSNTDLKIILLSFISGFFKFMYRIFLWLAQNSLRISYWIQDRQTVEELEADLVE